MKPLLNILLLPIIAVFVIQTCGAQASNIKIIDSSKIENITQSDARLEFGLPPLKTVIDSVLKRNAMVRFNIAEIEVKKTTLKSEQLYWTRNFGIQANTQYGTLNNFSTSDDSITNANNALSTVSTQFNYNVGFYVKFPIFDGINRKNQTKIAELQLDEAKALAQSQEDQLRQMVISQYHDLILKQKLLKIKALTLGNAKVNMEMVEKEFTNGITTVSEYVRISDITSRIESDYEVSKSNYLVAKKLLEDLAGFSFDLENLN